MMHDGGYAGFWHMGGWGLGHWLSMGLTTVFILVLIVLLIKALSGKR